MNFLKLVFLILFLISFKVAASENLYGSWENEDGERIDLIDGFKPNVGPAIVYRDQQITDVQSWSVNDSELKIGYSSGAYSISNDNNSMQWKKKQYKRIDNFSNTNIIDLKVDVENFINQLTTFSFYSYSKDYNVTNFDTTFSTTEGVMTQFDEDEKISKLASWGVGSGVLKIGRDVYIEAKISNNYLVAVDDRDKFIVLNKAKEKNILEKISLLESREEFLKDLKSGAWIVPSSYSYDEIYRFRPIEGDLKGRVFYEQNNKLQSSRVWEYSPSTGALKIGSTEYISGICLGGEILVLLKDNGDQKTYYKSKIIEDKIFHASDKKEIVVSERDVDQIKNMIGVVSSYTDQFTLFEFKEGDLSGYLHEWRTYPFQISGQTLIVEDNYEFNNTENIYLIEDYIVFGERVSRKIDLRETRLKPKTDSEAQADIEQAQSNKEQLNSKNVKLKINLKNGQSEIIILPIESFEKIKSISLVEE